MSGNNKLTNNKREGIRGHGGGGGVCMCLQRFHMVRCMHGCAEMPVLDAGEAEWCIHLAGAGGGRGEEGGK